MKLWKKITAFAAAAIVAALGGIAIAQVSIPAPSSMTVNDRVQIIPNGNTGVGNVYATLTQMKAWVLGGQSGHSSTPTLSSCGTSPSIATGSTDVSGRVTTGTGTPTGCVITFAQAFNAVPSCVVVSQTAYATTTPAYTVSTTAITLTQAAGDSRIYNYICASMNGG